MAATPGKKGTFLFDGGSVATIDTFDVPIVNDMIDVTSFTTSAPQWREQIAGLSGWSASGSGTFDPASTGQNNIIVSALAQSTAAVVFELDQAAGGKFNGGGFISGLNVSAVVDGESEISFDFTGSGSIAYTTTT